MTHPYRSDNPVASAGLKTILSLVILIGVNTPLFAQGTADPPVGGIVISGPGHQVYGEPIGIPGTSREQQEAELLAQKKAGCPINKLDPKTLGLLAPYLKSLVAQSNYMTNVHLTRHITTMNDPGLMAIHRQADQLSQQLLGQYDSQYQDGIRYRDGLFQDESPEADRALVYLLRVHFLYSDFDDDNIDCELAKRANRVRPLLDEMGRCLPLTGFEPYPHQMVIPLTKVRQRIKEIPNACSRNEGE